jgi:hypothetical protein
MRLWPEAQRFTILALREPDGKKPTTVIKVPVSIGNAVDV